MQHGRCVLPRLSWFHVRLFFSHFELLVHLVGGNPTMNTPRPRRGGVITSSSFIFSTCIGIPIYSVVFFVCDSASEFGAMGSTSFLGFPTLTCFLIFPELLFLGTCIIFFSQVLGLSLGLFL